MYTTARQDNFWLPVQAQCVTKVSQQMTHRAAESCHRGVQGDGLAPSCQPKSQTVSSSVCYKALTPRAAAVVLYE
jgi:hypothetical protein